jgi:hypothetical protein
MQLITLVNLISIKPLRQKILSSAKSKRYLLESSASHGDSTGRVFSNLNGFLLTVLGMFLFVFNLIRVLFFVLFIV